MREFRTSGSVGAPGEQSPGATRLWLALFVLAVTAPRSAEGTEKSASFSAVGCSRWLGGCPLSNNKINITIQNVKERN